MFLAPGSGASGELATLAFDAFLESVGALCESSAEGKPVGLSSSFLLDRCGSHSVRTVSDKTTRMSPVHGFISGRGGSPRLTPARRCALPALSGTPTTFPRCDSDHFRCGRELHCMPWLRRILGRSIEVPGRPSKRPEAALCTPLDHCHRSSHTGNGTNDGPTALQLRMSCLLCLHLGGRRVARARAGCR